MSELKYSWFVRIADNPMSIRRLSDNGVLAGRMVAVKNDIVFHSVPYLKGMPGFLMIPNFNPNANQKDLPFIKMWPPIGLEIESVTPKVIVDNIEPEQISYEEINDSEDEEDFDEQEQVSVEDLANQVMNDEPASPETEEPSTINYSALEPFYEYIDDNSYWGKLKKVQLLEMLEEAELKTDLTERWDLIKLVKRTIREKVGYQQD
jgi:hypothetical protein